ncbi:MAG: hypothetical protein JNL23_11945 [Chitinophagaceae bacterium]|nr:hypothetical protein [Chitinophagaceae bacterium]
MRILIICSFLAFSLAAPAQSPIVPKEIKFERNVVQKMNDKKSSTISYYYTESGDYAAIKPEEKKDGGLIIYNNEGKMIIVSEKEKTIIVMNMKSFLDRAVKKSEEMAANKKDSTHSTGSFRKTGNTKTICNYPADEYEVTNEKGKANIWFIKTDFALLPLLGMMGKNPMAGRNTGASNDWSDLPGIGKKFLMAEMEKDGKKVIETISISKTDFIFSSAGYTIRDMSDLMKGNYGQ